jgi:hypothetical protein
MQMGISFKNKNLKGVFIMPIKNAVQKANLMIGQINPHYDMTVNNVKEIHEVYGGSFETICCSFRLGYLQGMKAAKAEMKRGGAN